VSILLHEAGALLALFCLQPIVFAQGKIVPVVLLPHEAI